jgi:hypothetical protein
MKILAFLMAWFVTMNVHAQSIDKITALYLIGSEGSYVAAEKSLFLKAGTDCQVTVGKTYNRQNAFSLYFYGPNHSHWNVNFCAPLGMELQQGIYRNAARYPFNKNEAGLSISGDGRGCNEVAGEFEVLNIEYDVDGNIISFAANFVERCEKRFPPIFGSVRYNSNVPLATRFTEMFASTKENLVYLQRKNINENETLPEIVYFTGDNDGLQINALPYGGDGVEVVIDTGNGESWILDFAAPLEDNLTKGFYSNVERYPYNGYLNPGVDVVSPEGSFDSSSGWFKVLKCTKNDGLSIQEIALTFELKSDDEILEGAIHYKAKPKYDAESKVDDEQEVDDEPEGDEDLEEDDDFEVDDES